MTRHTVPPDSDALLLEALFQLALGGNTQGWEFERINAEVYERLRTAYPPSPSPDHRVVHRATAAPLADATQR